MPVALLTAFEENSALPFWKATGSRKHHPSRALTRSTGAENRALSGQVFYMSKTRS